MGLKKDDKPDDAVDIGGVFISRAKMRELVSHPKRFESNRRKALELEAYAASHDGRLPPWMDDLTSARWTEIASALLVLERLREAG